MNAEELKQFFVVTWDTTVNYSMSSLEQGDKETVDSFPTSDKVVDWVFRRAPPSITLLRPALGHLQGFVRYFESNVAEGLDASYLWGSLACLLKLVSEHIRALEHVPRMIKSLALKAESFNQCRSWSNLTSSSVKEVCFDIHVLLVEFNTNCIKAIRGAELSIQGITATGTNGGIQQTINRCYEMTSLQLAESILRLRKPVDNGPVVEYASTESVAKRRVLMMPPTKISRLFDRVDVFSQVDKLLTPDAADSVLQSVALHGIGGVGKTSIASSYAEKKYTEHAYDVVLWVHGEKEASLRQSFTDIALRLKLPGVQSQSHDENQILVHDWFQNTVYDNVESAQMLRPYWPRGTNQGRAIITTRNHSLGFDPAESGIEITSWDTDTGAAYLLFLLRRKIGRDMDSEGISAQSLSSRLSGHALAITQIAGLIYEGEYSIQEFMTIYMKSPQSVHREGGLGDLWQFVFESLDENCLTLLGIISFLQPDRIPPEMFTPPHEVELPSNLGFLKDHFIGLSGTLRKLSTRALIKRDKDSGILTVHRLIQTQFRYFLDVDRRQKAFTDTVKLLSVVLPKSDIEKGQLYDQWEKLNRYLQHAISLRDIFDEEAKAGNTLKAPEGFCELLNDYQRYLYEKCDFDECEKTCAVNRIAVSTLSSEDDKVDLECTILSHLSQVFEDRGMFRKAIEICQQQIRLRLGESPRKKILLAYSTSNLAISYVSDNDPSSALKWFDDAQLWWGSYFQEKGETRRYEASLLVYEARGMIACGNFDTAETMLDTVIAQVKEENQLNFGTLSIKHVKDSMEVTEIYKRLLPIDHGRNLFKLSEAMALGGDDKATAMKDEAMRYLTPQAPQDMGVVTETTWNDLITISRR
ncbi:hypothetical protein PG984_014794 [Apiospora sp. TS-2023a]